MLLLCPGYGLQLGYQKSEDLFFVPCLGDQDRSYHYPLKCKRNVKAQFFQDFSETEPDLLSIPLAIPRLGAPGSTVFSANSQGLHLNCSGFLCELKLR